MRHILYIILIAALTGLLVSCGDSRLRTILGRAEAVMNDHPDSALAMLAAVDRSKITRPRDSAIHAVLYAQARSKCYYYDSCDTDIRRAADYLTDERSHYGMLAAFYEGDILYNIDRYAEALEYQLKALEIATELNDRYWMARCHEAIADCYQEAYNMDGLRYHLRQAIDGFLKTGYDLNAQYAELLYIASISYSGHKEEAVGRLDSLRLNNIISDSTCKAMMYKEYARPLMGLGRYKEALEYITLADRYLDGNDQYYIINWPDVAQLLTHDNQLDSARRLIDRLDREYKGLPAPLRSNLHWARYEYYKATGDMAAALAEHEKATESKNELQSHANLNNFRLVEQNFYRLNAERQQALKTRAYWITVSMALLCALIVMIILFFYKDKLSEREQEFFKLSQEVSRHFANEEKQMKLLSQLSALLDISHRCLENRNSDEKWQKWRELYDKELQKILAPESMDNMISTVNMRHNSAYDILTDEFPDMSDNDRRLYVLVAYGFSAKSVSLILGIPIENYYNRLSRLRSRLRTSPDGRLLLAPLEM